MQELSNGLLIQLGFYAGDSSGNDVTINLPLSHSQLYNVFATVIDYDDFAIASISASFPNTSSIFVRIAYAGYRFSFPFHWMTIGF